MTKSESRPPGTWRRGRAPTHLVSLLGAVALVVQATLVAAPASAQGIVAPASRVPVLLVPGWGDGKPQLDPLQGRFVTAGWDPHTVDIVAFEDPEGSNVVHARELAPAVDRLIERTGAAQIDIVAHSMGGLAVRRYLLDGGAASVRKVVFLATPHRGTVSANVAWGDGAREMEPGSRFLLDLIRATPVPPEVRAITIRTPLDLHIIPSESATLPGVPDVEVCCPTHIGLLDDDETFRAIQRFLLSDLP
jgi:triacylglycerol lipase